MTIQNQNIDGGAAFDFGRTSADYAVYRDIYPPIFFQKLLDRGLGVAGQSILDLGTGTGVLPRAMYSYGARWTGVDISSEQIAEAKRLAAESGMDIRFEAVAAEEAAFAEGLFDGVTACQCFSYFNHAALSPKLARWLKPGGRLAVLYMAWLPDEDPIAGASERLALQVNPDWTGAGERMRPIAIPDAVTAYFDPVDHEEYMLDVPFTKETWHGRMRTCRGIGARRCRRSDWPRGNAITRRCWIVSRPIHLR